MWYAIEQQATEEEPYLCYQDGVNVFAISNVAIGFPLFRNWSEGLELGLGLGASKSFIAGCRQGYLGIGCRLPATDTRRFFWNYATKYFRPKTFAKFYKCGRTLLARQSATVTLEVERSQQLWRMMRSAGTYSGTTTLSRNLLLWCSAGTRVRAVLSQGRISTGPASYDLLTFVAMPYEPRSITAYSWALYRSVLRCLVGGVGLAAWLSG